MCGGVVCSRVIECGIPRAEVHVNNLETRGVQGHAHVHGHESAEDPVETIVRNTYLCWGRHDVWVYFRLTRTPTTRELATAHHHTPSALLQGAHTSIMDQSLDLVFPRLDRVFWSAGLLHVWAHACHSLA